MATKYKFPNLVTDTRWAKLVDSVDWGDYSRYAERHNWYKDQHVFNVVRIYHLLVDYYDNKNKDRQR